MLWKSKTYRPAYGTPIHFQPNGQSIIAVLKTDGLVLLDSKNGKTLAFENGKQATEPMHPLPLFRK